jgi:hypothetical protein
MSAYRFTAGTAEERRRWVSAVALGMRTEATSKYEVGGNLERAARLLERCDAEAGVIPLDALGTALTECVALEDIGRILGVQGPDVDLVAELRRAGGDGSMETRDFSTPAVLTVYFGVVAHGKDVYRESLDLLEYLMHPARAMSLHELFANERIMEHLWTQFPRLRDIPPFDVRGVMSLERWTAQAAASLGSWRLAIRRPS